jgi:hypothetical protein
LDFLAAIGFLSGEGIGVAVRLERSIEVAFAALLIWEWVPVFRVWNIGYRAREAGRARRCAAHGPGACVIGVRLGYEACESAARSVVISTSIFAL